ncbi:hypothetical protein K435DRAFT_800954 [Dendrothele bispora CBS 962.96]|uniref:Uncharacterized protein n=1 Tax=Dendrothele bispora (strain CBS 962.96) TaxID=1314807 RepID=A0A4S8LS30_DENBC|nr:hypothetical protein K435DRAFT_800954 [Dendrothele bispora CBS 962.96]
MIADLLIGASVSARLENTLVDSAELPGNSAITLRNVWIPVWGHFGITEMCDDKPGVGYYVQSANVTYIYNLPISYRGLKQLTALIHRTSGRVDFRLIRLQVEPINRIAPLSPTITQFTPVTVSWFREQTDLPGSWFLEKQHINPNNPSDPVFGTSEPLSVKNADGNSGTVVISFTQDPGTFRLLGFGGDFKTAAALAPGVQRDQTFFVGDPTLMVVRSSRTQGSTPAALLNGPTTAASDSVSSSFYSSSITEPSRSRRKRPAKSALFHRDLMVRTKGAEYFPGLENSRVFKFDEVETGIKTEKKLFAVSERSASNRPSQGDEDKRTPVLRRYSSSSDIDGQPPPSPARTDTYRPSESSDLPAADDRPKLPARTDRQMGIQDQIMALRQQMIRNRSSSSSAEISKLRKRIKELEGLQNSDWALELTDVVPPGLEGNTQT